MMTITFIQDGITLCYITPAGQSRTVLLCRRDFATFLADPQALVFDPSIDSRLKLRSKVGTVKRYFTNQDKGIRCVLWRRTVPAHDVCDSV